MSGFTPISWECIAVPSKNIGKVITKIKINKETVHIYLSNGEKYIFTNEVMSNFYLYIGKNISNKEIKEIKEFSDNAVYLKYAISLLKKRHYSEWKLREKLYAKEASKKAVDKIIKILKNADLVNDKMLAEDLKSYLEEKNYGKNKIINYLNNEGIFDDTIKTLRFPDSFEKKKASNNIAKLEKKYAKYPYESKKQHIYTALIALGFDNDIASSSLDKIKSPNQKEENDKLDKDFPKIVRKYINKYEGRELKEKVISSLRSKGYKMNDILRKFEAYYAENDF